MPIFGLLGAEITKPFVRYSLPPNDRFAALLPFTFAVGRIGCLMSGCCRGIPTDGTLAIVCEDGIRRHPVPLYEIVFHVIAGTTGVWLVRHKRFSGRVFSLFLMAYGLFDERLDAIALLGIAVCAAAVIVVTRNRVSTP